MAAKTILQTTNLTFDDIRDTLNSGGGNVNNAVATAFDEIRDINKWAKNKPEYFKKDFYLTDDDRKANRYGLTLPTNESQTTGSGKAAHLQWLAIEAFMNNPSIPNYSYTLPVGTVNSPMRLGDFRGYRKDAERPFYTRLVSLSDLQYVNLINTDTIRVTLNRKPDKVDLNIGDLFGDASTLYLTAEVYVGRITNWNSPNPPTNYYSTNPVKTYKCGAPVSQLYASQYIDIDLKELSSSVTGGLKDKSLEVVVGINRWSGTTKQERNGLIMPWESQADKGFYYRLWCYEDWTRNDAVTGVFVNGTMYGLTTTVKNTTQAYFGVRLNVERMKQDVYVCSENQDAPQGKEKIMYRFVPTNYSGSVKTTGVIGRVRGDASFGSITPEYMRVPSATTDGNFTTVYLMFENVFTGAGQINVGYLEGSNNGGVTWNAIRTASFNIYIKKTS